MKGGGKKRGRLSGRQEQQRWMGGCTKRNVIPVWYPSYENAIPVFNPYLCLSRLH